ncbi:prepilin-type N-terminal cleavage/methylation domain-containing protein [Geobacter hydrogenophilus]|uniref:Prepilin-type N-terminal cleavage/methylation domain-containing protein n=1 Tax=Geobacter hydrogenophilus TaxID=40983 RepID=A0A9W6G1M8_9BACT|nr:prepilin-type N-terminal cleavage/methylation domain-containing protein [Geobacter hydrogenophilus]MBT0892758.1 prepilin-type N-terminal cleavage/methylation domain-containing protein [Geobacter hydrogenophilus]GLI38769.1 hypothetical protein GHYDROH2_22700 [Geobacter hydrogenophilus]
MECVKPNSRGFTLVELVVVIGIFGVIMGAVYSIYLTHLKNAYSQEELIDVQQNLRTAMDMITRDLRMAGVLLPNDVKPLDKITVDSLQINTVSASGKIARIAESKATSADSTFSILVDSSEAVDGLLALATDTKTPITVRLIRPFDRSNPISSMDTYLVLELVQIPKTDRDTRTVVMKRPSNKFVPGTTLVAGDIIAATGPPVPPGTDPPAGYDSIVYKLDLCPDSPNQQCLLRIVNQTETEIIAGPISTLQFNYLYTKGSEDNSAEEDSIRAVRVTITAKTPETAPGGARSKQLTSVISVRNRR